MKKQIWVVSLIYFFEGDIDKEIQLFDTYDKAKEFFNVWVEKEKTQTWIADTDSVEITQDNDYFYAYDTNDYYETCIKIEKKEIL